MNTVASKLGKLNEESQRLDVLSNAENYTSFEVAEM